MVQVGVAAVLFASVVPPTDLMVTTFPVTNPCPVAVIRIAPDPLSAAPLTLFVVAEVA